MKFNRIIQECYKKIDTAEIYTWARKNIVLPRSYAEPGPFFVEKSRYLIEPFKAIKSLEVRQVVCEAAVQTGKSLLADISIPWFVVHRSGPIQFSQKTEQMIANHINDRLYPLMQNCKPLKNYLPTSLRDYTDTGIRFGNCTLYANGQAESNFQAKSIMFQVVDECWMFDRGNLKQAIQRTTAFDRKGTSKILIVSQPGTVNDDFDVEYNKGTCEEWSVPCVGCNQYFFPDWTEQNASGSYVNMKWDINDTTKPSGSYNYPELIKTIRYVCKDCGYEHVDSEELKDKWNREGKYIITNDNPTDNIRSFRWNSLVKDKWSDLVIEFLDAQRLTEIGLYDNLTQFFQKRLARPFNPVGNVKQNTMKIELYDVQSTWPDAVARIMTIDLQKYGFYTEIREWSKAGDSRQLYFGALTSEEDILRIKTQFGVENAWTFVDIANPEKQLDGGFAAYSFVDRNRFTGLRGDGHGEDGYIWKNVQTPAGKQNIKLYFSQPQMIPNSINRTHYYNFSPTICRDIFGKLRDGKSKEWKVLDNNTYLQQVFAEQRKKVIDQYGNIKFKWFNTSNDDNHAFDLGVMQVVCSMIHPGVELLPKYMSAVGDSFTKKYR